MRFSSRISEIHNHSFQSELARFVTPDAEWLIIMLRIQRVEHDNAPRDTEFEGLSSVQVGRGRSQLTTTQTE